MQRSAPLVTPVLVAGCVVMLVSFAVRSSFGVFQIPVADEFGWARGEFSLAIGTGPGGQRVGPPLAEFLPGLMSWKLAFRSSER